MFPWTPPNGVENRLHSIGAMIQILVTFRPTYQQLCRSATAAVNKAPVIIAVHNVYFY